VDDDVHPTQPLAHGLGDYYYAVRAQKPATQVEQAARIIYLNKTGFNGLYRENSRGEFNVPFGRYANPNVRDEVNLRACSLVLQGVEVRVEGFAAVLERAQPGDLVYFDPPYVPVSLTANFTKYAKDGFDEREQRHLADVYAELTRRGVKAILSNSDTPLIDELYRNRGYHFGTVMATRNVNRDATGRGAIPEALVRNFDGQGRILAR
jgi:DNA adenine methylase